jgi:hypothetical protein
MPNNIFIPQKLVNEILLAAVEQNIKPKKLDNAPELWDKLLDAVREIYEPTYVCVAGGAIRDHLLEKPPKDIDIFIKLPPGDYTGRFVLDNAETLGWKNPVLKNDQAYENAEVQCVVGAKAFDYEIDLCFLFQANTGEEVVKNFDFGICQHWYDGEIHSTKAGDYGILKKRWYPLKKLDATLREHFNRVNKRHGKIYTLDEGEPWYQKFAGEAKIK